YPRATSAVLSVDPSSITITSDGGRTCTATDASASPIVAARLYAGTTTEIGRADGGAGSASARPIADAWESGDPTRTHATEPECVGHSRQPIVHLPVTSKTRARRFAVTTRSVPSTGGGTRTRCGARSRRDPGREAVGPDPPAH